MRTKVAAAAKAATKAISGGPTPAGPTTSNKPAQKPPPPREEDIRVRAYLKWEAAGKPWGDGVDFWLAAEQELHQGEWPELGKKYPAPP
jgi:hypothetical protein